MRNTLLGSLTGLLMPLASYGMASTSYSSYQRNHSQVVQHDTVTLGDNQHLQRISAADVQENELTLQSGAQLTELIIVDAAVPDKHELRRLIRPGVALIELSADRDAVQQIISELEKHHDLRAVHLVSHAEVGALQVGEYHLDRNNLPQQEALWSALNKATRSGADLMLYGCNLAAKNDDVLDIIQEHTHLDVAASDNFTGAENLGGDWNLEIHAGDIQTQSFSASALKDFSDVLATTVDFQSVPQVSDTSSTTQSGYVFSLTHLAHGGYPNAGTISTLNSNCRQGGAQYSLFAGYLDYYGAPADKIYIQKSGGGNFALKNIRVKGGATVIYSGMGGGNSVTAGVKITAYKSGVAVGSPVTQTGISGVFASIDLSANTDFADVDKVRIQPLKSGGADSGSICLKTVGFDAPLTAPTVTNANISISGASGAGGAYKIGDTVTATWNNTAGGDNNPIVSGVTVDFSQFGGGAAVVANNSSNTWTATYTITAGAIDLTARNVSVTATNTAGSVTTADSTNATVDNVAPIVTDPRISISGATGTSGAYKIGDTVTATWNNTVGGDNNTDTISPVTVNFSQFGGGATVAATNSSGTWTATYTIVAGAIDATGRNISFSATDNAGNVTTAADTTGATIDNIAPTLSSITLSGSPASTDSSMAFVASFSESVSNISTDDFTLATTSGTATGSIASVSASSGSSVNININSISGNGVFKLNLNGSTNIADDAGNTGIAAFSSGSTHTVAIPTAPGIPTIGTATAGDGQVSVTFTAPGNNGGSAITTYTATASPGGAFGTCAGPAACTATVTGLSNGTAYTFTVTATNAIGTSTASGASNSATPKGNQTITFGNPGAQNFGTTPTLNATAPASGLIPTFSSSTTGVCTITSGGALTFVTAGSCTIDADQAGNTAWNAATTVTQTFTVNAILPGAPTIGTATAGDTQATVTFTAPASNGGAAIIASGYTVTANPGGATATGSSSPVTVTGLTNGISYTFTVTATNSVGTGSASAASNSITPAAPQAIIFGNPGTQNFGTTPTLSATSDSNLTVSFTSSTTGVCTITSGGALTFVTVGSCTINANQAGDSSYLAASQVSQTFSISAVAPGAPTTAIATVGDTQASIAFTAPAFIGGAAVTGYTVTVNPADVAPVSGASSPIVVTGLTNGQPYTFTVTATNSVGAGSASAASNSITPAATQTITFTQPSAQNFGTTPTFSATADSGLNPIFASSTTGVCTITSLGTVTFVTVGTCTINADQPGNGSYLAAPQVTRSFTVNAVVPGAPIIGTATAGDAQASVTFTAPAFVGGAAITTYTVTANPGGATASGSGSPVTVTGLTNGTGYTFTVTATNSVGTGSASAASNSVAPNGAPVIGGTPATSVNEDTAYSFTPTANDTLGDTLTFSITNKPAWASFNTTTGELAGTPTNSNVGTTNNVLISVSDGALSDSLPAFNLTVVNVNDAPTIVATPITVINQGEFYEYTPTAADVDADALTFDAINLPGWLSIDTTTGRIYGTPGQDDVGVSPFDIFIRVSDGVDVVWSDAFLITVNNVNDAPTITGSPTTDVDQDVAYSFTPTGNDVDTGTTLTYSIANKPTWASFDTATGALTGTPVEANIGVTNSIVISVSDGTLSASLPAFNLTVVNVNDAPVISGTPTISVNQDVAYSFVPTASDVDTGTTLTYSITNKPTWASFDTATGALTGTPVEADIGVTNSIVITVSDGTLSASLPAFNLTVVNVNDAPVISGTPTVSVDQDMAYSFVPTAGDVDTGTTLTYSIANKPVWASFDTATGALTGTPVEANIGVTNSIVISVSDGTLSASLPAFNLTVVNVNDAPVISGTPTISVNQDVAYSFVPTASDVDTGTTLTYSIANKPVWASFDTATGALTGTPVEANIGVTNSIVISVSDGTLSASLPAFNLTVVNVNDAPVISGTPTISVNQDVAYSFVPTASDVDTGTTLSYSITNKPTWASFDTATGALTGTPVEADIGVTNSIVITVSDGTLSVSLAAFNLTVVNVNDAPVISGTPTLSIDQDVAYSFVPTVTDADVGTTLTFNIANKPVWASFDTATGALAGTPVKADVGTTSGIVITVTDGEVSANLPAFAIEVVSTADPLAPILLVPANIELKSQGLYTPVSLRQLIGLNPTATQAELDQALADLASDSTSGNACCAARPAGLNANGNLLLPPGRHEVVWTATNAAGLSVTEIQTVDVTPLISLSKSQIAIRGSTVEFRIILNGPSPTYPLAVSYVIDEGTTAGSGEHSLVDGVANFTQAGQLEVAIPVQLTALTGLSDSQLVVRVDGDINPGVSNRHIISIREGNVAPTLTLQLSQGGVSTTRITPTGGPVTVTATVADLNPGDTHSYDWSASDTVLGDTDGNPVNATLVFDPASLTGRHQVQLTVTDSAGASANTQLYFRIVASLPVLSATVDTDGDGVDDLTEGYGDSSGNGIPDYLDNMPSSNILPQVGAVTTSYLIECDPGVRCGLGQFALSGNSGGVQILDDELGATGELVVDPAFEPVGGVFDFVIRDLPTPGQSVRIVIPQQAAIPANATYRKYQKGRWVSFIENASNTIFSAPGNPGYCPPPGNPEWTTGLTEGHLCVQLTIEDGGPNDDDGLVNAAIADPGAVSAALPVEPPEPPEPPVEPPKPPVEVKSKGGGAMGGLWLILLGGLIVLKRLKPIWIALVALVVASANTQAGDDNGFYLRADISNVVSSQEEDDFTSALVAANHEFVISHYDENRSGYHLALGKKWNSTSFTELGYLDLGDVQVNLTLPSNADVNAFAQDFAANYPLSAEGFTLVQGVVLSPGSLFKVSAEVGVFVWRTKTAIEKHVFTVPSDEGEDPLVGLKFEVPLSESLGMGFGLRRIYFDNQETDLFSLTGSYHF